MTRPPETLLPTIYRFMKNNSLPPKSPRADQESRAYNWALLATLILLASLLAQAPSRILARALPADIKPMISAWGGTVWNGQANVGLPEGQAQVRWRMDFPALFRIKAAIRWEADAGDSHLSGALAREPGGWAVREASGTLDRALLQSFAKSLRLPAASIRIKSLDIIRHGRSWAGSRGEASHPGGQVGYSANGQTQHLVLPPVVLTLSGGAERLELHLTQQQGGDLADFSLHDGILDARIRQRLLQLSPEYHGAGQPDMVAVAASQPLNSL